MGGLLSQITTTGRRQRARKREQQLKKNVKSRVFWIFEKKNVKKRKNCTHSFSGHLITPVFNTQLPKVSTGKSPTSNILLCNNVSVITQLNI